MTAEQFTIWLHGYLEISGAKELKQKEVQLMIKHLQKQFKLIEE
jgi:hypothetical protein